MASNSLISIILCTCNRAGPLQHVLRALEKVSLRSEWETELIVVDNSSKDDTAMAVKNAKLANMNIRYFHESRMGKGYALNAGLEQARGDVILFTDDDVVPSEDWAKQLIAPLLCGNCDAVTGRITLAQNLMRPWLTPAHKLWLASSDVAELHEGSRELIGANMAFRRSILERVRAFDPELGPGALGLAEDTLFGWQLVEAGFKIGYAAEARVTHQPDASRLQRSTWLNEARKRGRSEAYLLYHWEHSDVRHPRLSQLYYFSKLQLRRLLQRPRPLESEGCPGWEMSYVLHMEKCKHFCLERRRPRNYARHGLIKRVPPEHSDSRGVETCLTETQGQAIH